MNIKNIFGSVWIILGTILLVQLILSLFSLGRKSEYDYMYLVVALITFILIILTFGFLMNMFFLIFKYTNIGKILSIIYFVGIGISSLALYFTSNISKNIFYMGLAFISLISIVYLLSYKELNSVNNK